MPKREWLSLIPSNSLTEDDYESNIAKNDMTAVLFVLILLLKELSLVVNMYVELRAQIDYYESNTKDLHLTESIFNILGVPSDILNRMYNLLSDKYVREE